MIMVAADIIIWLIEHVPSFDRMFTVTPVRGRAR